MRKFLAVAALALALAVPAQALTITPGDAILTGNQTSNVQILNAIAAAGYTIGPSLYKSDVGGADSGYFAGSYDTAYFNTSTDPEDAVLTWLGGESIHASPVYIIVKDGNSTPAWYLFRVSWNGQETIYFNDFWPSNGAISHIDVHGTHVPDGGSVAMLLGAALMGLAGLRRFMK
jgi:hypothetical protein